MTEKNEPKDQHFFPEMFLRGFTNENNNIYMLDKRKKKISDPRNVSSVAKKKHLYTVFEDGKRNYEVEKRFGEIESNAAAVFKKIVSNDFEDLTNTEVSVLIEFVVLTTNRTPLATEIAEEVMSYEEVQQQMKKINPDEAQRYIDQCLVQKGLSYAVTLLPHFRHRHSIITQNFDAYLLTSDNDAPPFVLHDRYMCLEMISHDVFYKGSGKEVDWSKMNVKKHFLISSRHCVSFVPKTDAAARGTAIMKFFKVGISKQDVSLINGLALAYMHEYAYCSNKEMFEGYLSEL